jgi:hypothetical protein
MLLPLLPPLRGDYSDATLAADGPYADDDTATRVARYLCRKFVRPPSLLSSAEATGVALLDDAERATDAAAADASCLWLNATALATLRHFETWVRRTNSSAQSHANNGTTAGNGNQGLIFADVVTLTDKSLAPANQVQRIVVASLHHPHLQWPGYSSDAPADAETTGVQEVQVDSSTERLGTGPLPPHSRSPTAPPRRQRRPWRVLVVGDSNAVVFDWAHALWGGARGHVNFDVHWVVGASSYGLRTNAFTSGSSKDKNMTHEPGHPTTPHQPPIRTSHSGAAARFAGLNASRYDAVLVSLGFVDCNYVAPFRRLRTPAQPTAPGVGTPANTTTAGAASGRGGHDDVDTLSIAARRAVAFAEAAWVQAQGVLRRRVVYLGPNPPVATPRYQPPTVAWQDPTPHRLALTAVFTALLRAQAEKRGFGFATILSDVLNPATNQPKVQKKK